MRDKEETKRLLLKVITQAEACKERSLDLHEDYLTYLCMGQLYSLAELASHLGFKTDFIDFSYGYSEEVNKLKCRFILDTPNVRYILERAKPPKVGDLVSIEEYDNKTYLITELEVNTIEDVFTYKGEEIK